MTEQVKLIGVCLSTIHDADRFNFISEFNKSAVRNGYRLLIFNSCTDLYEQKNPNNDGESSVFRIIPYDRLSALVIFSNFIYNKDIVNLIIENCHKNNVPVISVDKEFENCINFSFDYSNTFENLCNHIIRVHGAENIFMIAGVEGNDFSEARVEAFRKALEENNIPFDRNNIGYGNFWEGPTKELLKKWFINEKRPIPDAIVCANDTMAIVASCFLQEMGFEIPKDCIITGFDGIMEVFCHIPHITTCHQDYGKMSELIVDTVKRTENGEDCRGAYVVGFEIIYSQSCGCKRIDTKHVNEAMQNILEMLRESTRRQELMCSVQSSISKMKDLRELPHILIDKFAFHTNVFAVNPDVFREPDFGADRKAENSFGDSVEIMYQRYFWNQYEPCIIDIRELLPDFEKLTCRQEPIIICPLHFFDMVIGYCAFQPEIITDEYQKMHTLLNALNASLGNFHSRIQINSINKKLLSVNDELQRLSVHDYMTGLFNRRGFYSEFYHMLERNTGDDLSIVIVSADLDGLKYINDNFGHIEGDNAISTVGKALMSSSVSGEICARFGGDEFSAAIIMETEKAEDYPEEFKRRFRSYLSEYNRNSGKPYSVESSIGFYTETISDDFNLDRIIKTADDKMYADKVARKKQRKK